MKKIVTCVTAPFESPNGLMLFALVCRKGYSFSAIETWLEGVISTEADAIACVNSRSKS